MSLTADLRHSIRLLGRSPVFTLTSVISLALGIGAAATIFSLTDALLFEPTAGVRNASELVDIGRANQGSGFDNMSHPAYRYLREHSRTLDIAAVDFGGGPMSLGTDRFARSSLKNFSLRASSICVSSSQSEPNAILRNLMK